MINLNDSAKIHLDNYLEQVRACLKECTKVDADEVEQNIIDHIESELEGIEESISFEELDAVLKKLGSPSQWVPEEEITWWRKIIIRLRTGPEDWRLAYISFTLFIIGILVGSIFRFSHPVEVRIEMKTDNEQPIIATKEVSPQNNGSDIEELFSHDTVGTGVSNVKHRYRYGPMIFLVFLLASFCTSRAAIGISTDKKELRGKKWLLYPSLISTYAPIFLAIMLWPIVPLCILANWLGHGEQAYSKGIDLFNARYEVGKYYTVWTLLIAGIIGLCWIILGLLTMKWPEVVKRIFRPFADRYDRKWALILIFAGLGLMALSLIIETAFIMI